MKTVSKDGRIVKPWKRYPGQMKFNWEEEDEIFTLKWSVPFTSDKSTVTFIAYTFPFSFTEMTEKLDEIEESAST